MATALPDDALPDDALPDESSTQLALAAREGDLDALDNFVRALQRDVRRYVAHLSADPHAADDLTRRRSCGR